MLPAQGGGPTPAELLRIADTSNPFSVRVETLLRADRWESWRDGWRMARDAGPAMAPGLWERMRKARGRGRLVLLGAFGAASGGAAQELLLDAAWIQRADRLDRVMALLVAALAPEPTAPSTRRSSRSNAQRLLTAGDSAPGIAAAMALGRTTAMALKPQWFGRDREDPGPAAAALWAGTDLPEALVRHWLERDVVEERAGLVWRAALLSRHDKADLTLARRAMAAGQPRSVHRAAAAWLVREASPEARDEFLGVLGQTEIVEELTVLLATDVKTRRTALARGLLTATPSPRLASELRRQVVVLFAASAPLARLKAAAPAWRETPEVASAACLALACRAFSGDTDLAQAPWLRELSALPGGRWLRAAGTGPVARDELRNLENGTGDEFLGRAWQAFIDDRMGNVAVVRALEDALWRIGAHPTRPRQTAELALVGDLLLAGSDYARARRGGGESFPYLPGDLQPDNRRFFEVAFEFFRWVVEERDRQVPDRLRFSW